MYMNSNKKENNNISVFSGYNPYGYRYNVNHPYINELYCRYKKWKGIPQSDPMSNEQRKEFEAYVDSIFSESDGK